MIWQCALCGLDDADGHQIDGAHVRGKVHFSKEEIIDGFDRSQNIIRLCVKHHKAFDAAKNIVIVDIDEATDLRFARWNCCRDGVCVKTPVNETFRNLFQQSMGIPCMKIKKEYILEKNQETNIAELYEFSKNVDRFTYKECLES